MSFGGYYDHLLVSAAVYRHVCAAVPLSGRAPLPGLAGLPAQPEDVALHDALWVRGILGHRATQF